MKRLIPPLLVVFLAISVPDALAAPSPSSAVVAMQSKRARARASLDDLRRLGGKLTVHWPVYRATPTMVRGLTLALPGDDLVARARTFFARYGDLVANAQLQLATRRGTRARRILRFRQTYRGLPVIGGQINVSFDAAGRVRALHSKVATLSPASIASIKPALSPTAALALTYRKINAGPPSARVRARVVPTLAVLPLPGGQARLVYSVTPPMEVNPLGLVHTIDARSGAHLGAHRGVLFHAAPRRRARRANVGVRR